MRKGLLQLSSPVAVLFDFGHDTNVFYAKLAEDFVAFVERYFDTEKSEKFRAMVEGNYTKEMEAQE